MQKKSRLSLIPKYSDKLILLSSIVLGIYGSFMIISAEMGEASADLGVVSTTTIKQFAYLLAGIVAMIVSMKIGHLMTNLRKVFIWVSYFGMLFLLILPRAFAPAGGAYGWIRIGPASLQPSEFAKLYIVFLASRLFAKDNPKTNMRNFKYFGIGSLIYVGIVFIIENDFGSAIVIGAIAFVCMLIAPCKEFRKYQNWMILFIVFVLILAIFILSPKGTDILSHFSNNYKILRFLSSANPFNYQYDSGYHLIMSLVSFANGGLWGLGYTKSIHKYMNFPNPSTDFILPVICEEMGLIFGLLPVLLCYGAICLPLIYHSKKCPYTKGKIMMIGTFMYFVLHFVFNVGGVSGLIPLTGVPLLLVSSGGSSLISCMMALGFAQSEIDNYRKEIICA